MAKLSPKDPQFGIPVAARIRKELAFRFNAEAGKTGKTLSRYISEYIEKIAAIEKRVIELSDQLIQGKTTAAGMEKLQKELEAQLTKEREIAKKVTGRFILEITKGNQKQANQLIQTFNTILKDEKSK